LLIGAFLALTALLPLVACGSLNGDTFIMKLVNDAPREVSLYYCRDSTCGEFLRPVRVAPGDSFELNMVAKKGFIDRYLVEDSDGNLLGCMHLEFETPRPGARIPISDAEPCPEGHTLP
jgi:hypothetical protein